MPIFKSNRLDCNYKILFLLKKTHTHNKRRRHKFGGTRKKKLVSNQLVMELDQTKLEDVI